MLDTYLMEISGFNSPEWDTMKLVTALKKISCLEEEVEHPAEVNHNTILQVCFQSVHECCKLLRTEVCMCVPFRCFHKMSY
jgi:hypothetical protein